MGPNFLFLAPELHIIASKYPKSSYQKIVKSTDILLLYRSLKHQNDNFLLLSASLLKMLSRYQMLTFGDFTSVKTFADCVEH